IPPIHPGRSGVLSYGMDEAGGLPGSLARASTRSSFPPKESPMSMDPSQQYPPQYPNAGGYGQPQQPSGDDQPPAYGYAQPSDPMYGQAAAAPVATKTSGWAIASLVCSLVGAGLLGVIFGHIALNEIKKSNGFIEGRGLALAGLIIGYIGLGIGLCVC